MLAARPHGTRSKRKTLRGERLFPSPRLFALCSLYRFSWGLMGMLTPAAEASKMKSPSRSHGGQEAGASIFGTTTQQNRVTLEPSRYSDYG